MKRLINILLSVLLSLTLVYLGAGIVILKCCKDKILTDASSDKCCRKSCCYGVRESCLTFTVIKLPSAIKAQQDKSSSPDLPVCDILTNTIPVVFHCTDIITSGIGALQRMYHSPPPREYLTFIRVLII